MVDPDLSAAAGRRLMRKAYSPRHGRDAAEVFGGVTVGLSVICLLFSLVLHFTAGVTWWWSGWTALSVLAGAGLTRVGSLNTLDVRDRARLVDSSDLDALCGDLLLRAQRAVAAVRGSGLYARDLLDRAAGDMTLRRHEWEIAVALREMTELRAQIADHHRDGTPGPMTAAVLDRQQAHLDESLGSARSRIEELERYAAQVKMADAAERDWRRSLRAAGLNDRYLDLVARTAGDKLAIAEIRLLSEQAAAAAEVFSDKLHQAALTAHELTKPPSPPAGATGTVRILWPSTVLPGPGPGSRVADVSARPACQVPAAGLTVTDRLSPC